VTRDPLGLSRSDWEELASELGLERFRARQIFDALHLRGVRDMPLTPFRIWQALNAANGAGHSAP